MSTSGFIRDELQNEEFYLKAASLFLRNSYGMEDRICAMVSMIPNIVSVGEGFFKYLDIWHVNESTGIPDYFEYTGCDPEAESDYWLELIGALLGIYRQVQVSYTDENDTAITEIITLNNYEYLVYIQATIQKNHIAGRREDLRKIYHGSAINFAAQYEQIDPEDQAYFAIDHSYIEGLYFQYLSISDPNGPMCYIVYKAMDTDSWYRKNTDNIELLFQNGYLAVENLGIEYEKVLTDSFQGGYFEPADKSYVSKFYEEGSNIIVTFQ